MNHPAFFRNNAPGRLAGLAGLLLLAALCWTAATLFAVSRTVDALDATLLEDVRQRNELATTVERLARYGETILHAPEKSARHKALAEALALEGATHGPKAAQSADARTAEVLSAVFAQLQDLSANRDEQERFAGLVAERLAAFDALVATVAAKIPAGSDSWNVALVLAKLRLELEHTDATAETRWELLADELATQAKVLRLEGADQTAALLDRVPAHVQDVAQLRRRMAAYHRSNHEQWDVAAALLDQLAQDLSVQDTPAEQRLAGLRADANLALAILLAATFAALALGYAALRKKRHGPGLSRSPYKAPPDPAWAESAAAAPATGQSEIFGQSTPAPHETGRIEPETENVAESPDTLLPELRNLFAQASPAALALADALRRQLASGPHKGLADEIYVRAAFGEYGKALESLEKLNGRLRKNE